MRRVHLVAVAALFAICGCTDIRKAHFASYGEARTAGLAERGWLPRCVVPAAREIEEAHSLDTNEQWIAYVAEFPPDSAWKPLTREQVDQLAVRKPHGVDWWPAELSSAGDVARSGWTVLDVPEPGRRCFISLRRGMNFCWCDPT